MNTELSLSFDFGSGVRRIVLLLVAQRCFT